MNTQITARVLSAKDKKIVKELKYPAVKILCGEFCLSYLNTLEIKKPDIVESTAHKRAPLPYLFD